METMEIMETDAQSKVQKRREKFFWIQTFILGFILIVTIFTFLTYNNMKIEKGIKVFFAPFLSIVPLVFALSIIKDWIKTFTDGEYSKGEKIKFSMIALVVAIVFTVLAKLISMVTATEILIAIMIAIICLLSFLTLKVRDIVGMSIITGIAEGVIVYMVFIF
jgi:uncharacterized membrane protein YhaH (DUF805 family)